MIHKDHPRWFYITCDVCGETHVTAETFEGAVTWKKDNGWRSQKHKGEWGDVCPECQEQEK